MKKPRKKFKRTRLNKAVLIRTWIIIVIVILFVLTFEVGYLTSNTRHKQALSISLDNAQSRIYSLESSLGIKDHYISNITEDLSGKLTESQDMQQVIADLGKRLEELEAKDNEKPFFVPTTGTVGSWNGTFGGNMLGYRHLGIDIWTTTENSGQIGSNKGNPVYSACSGKVVTMTTENGGLTIDCDEIDQKYNVPEHKVYTHYAHMGNPDTGEMYYTVEKNQRVEAGDLIGYQGDVSSYFPDMRNIHLHFSIFTGTSETDTNGGALNPCLYIKGDCMRRSAEFEAKAN